MRSDADAVSGSGSAPEQDGPEVTTEAGEIERLIDVAEQPLALIQDEQGAVGVVMRWNRPTEGMLSPKPFTASVGPSVTNYGPASHISSSSRRTSGSHRPRLRRFQPAGSTGPKPTALAATP